MAERSLREFGHVQDRCEIEAVGLPVGDRIGDVEALGLADGLLERSESELGEQLAYLLSDVLEEVDDEFRLPGELLAQLGVLSGHADRAGVEVADPHHDAARHHQWSRGESELVATQEGGDHHVATGLELAIDLDDDPVA